MAILNEPGTPEYPDGIYQIETTDPVVGGPPNEATGAGLDNIPHLQLAKRTQWLRNRIDVFLGRTVTGAGLASGGGDLSANRVIMVPAATTAEAEAGTINTKALTPASGLALVLAALRGRTISGGGLATGGGDLSANRTITVPAATTAEAQAATINTKALTPAGGRALFDALAAGMNTALDALWARTITGTGLATGGGALNTNRTISVPKATAAQAEAGTSDTVALTPLTGRALVLSELEKTRVRASLSVTVGAGGHYATINEALRALSERNVPYVYAGVGATITLLAGFVMREQVLVDGINLGWITIVGADTQTTIDRSALTRQWANNYPAFGVRRGGTLPVIGQLFVMNAAGTATDRVGMECTDNGFATIGGGSGFRQCPAPGVSVITGGSLSASGAVLTNNNIGVTAGGGTRIAIMNADLRNNGQGGVTASNGAVVQAENVNCFGCGEFGIRASRGATINASGAAARRGASNSNFDMFVQEGGIITAFGTTGGISQPLNTVTSNGIIFG